MNRSRYLIGIDLGTTNSALAYVDTKGRERPAAEIRVFEVPQLVAAGEIGKRVMLPSAIYLPGLHDLPPGAGRLPWDERASAIVGDFARIQGASVPERLVTSAKSWLCHPGVDREAEILPWGASAEVNKVSPVEASAAYLAHLRDAWNHEFARDDPSARFEDQEIVLTAPASFDEAARELTLLAAKRAGIAAKLTLLEEPQAAFYCWIVSHNDRWQAELRAGERILVCDIGGGTTDFSLITVVETTEGPGFRRVAVGDHLMLGGDNMDLALAHLVERKLGSPHLDAKQWSALAQACRAAKERLLADDPPPRWPVTIAGRGSRLIGGSLQSELSREDVAEALVEGFFPKVAADAEPAKGARSGLREFGLPFVSDPAITRHLAAFLRECARESGAPGVVVPETILFNGGALAPRVLRERIVTTLASWSAAAGEAKAGPRLLVNDSLDLAVAIGAAYYGIVRRGGGIRIGGGTARSYYVGFESEHRAKPWLCVVPRDAQEGDEIRIENADFDLLMGRRASFPLASSSVRPQDRPGDFVAEDPDSIRVLPPLNAEMKQGRKAKSERVSVRLEAKVSEVGVIELWCHSRTDDRRWRLQIQLRSSGADARKAAVAAELLGEDPGIAEESVLVKARDLVRSAFSASPPPATGIDPVRVVKLLEEALETDRGGWSPSILRGLWDPLLETIESRRRGAGIEAKWLNLAGFCLRPGVGFALDEQRIKALWPLFHQGVHHVKDPQCWSDWWVLWRRVAPGLSRSQHEEIHRRVLGLLPTKGAPAKKTNRPRIEPHELEQIWRLLASLERIPAAAKEKLGAQLVDQLDRDRARSYAFWCLGRLGARAPLMAPANVVVTAECAERWALALEAIEPESQRERSDLIFALAEPARMTGDRARDLDPEARARAIARLESLGAEDAAIAPVREYHDRAAAEASALLGEELPIGLRLASTPGDSA